MKPLVLTSELVAPVPPAGVWSVLADVAAWPQWCPPLRRLVRFEGLQVGRRIAYVLAMGPGFPVAFDVELEIVDPPRCLQWWSTKWWGVTGTRAFVLTPVDGGTRIEDRKTFESRLWPVAGLYPRGLVRNMSDGWLDGLAAEAVRRVARNGEQ